MSKKPNIAVVGATGVVGSTFLKVLEERDFPFENIYMMASARSAGKTVTFYMHLPTSLLTYNTSCFVGFLFKVNGSIFVCASSYKEGTQTVFVGDEYFLF